MHYGLIMEGDYRYGHSEEEAFDEPFAMQTPRKTDASTEFG